MLRTVHIAAIVSTALLAAGCSVSRILSADFDGFPTSALDADFAGALAGMPQGDAIESHPFLNGSLSIETDGPAGGGNNLRVIDISPPGVHRPALVSFAVADHDVLDEYRIVWKGSTEGSTHHTEVVFLDIDGHEAIRLIFIDQAGDSPQALLLSTGTLGIEPIDVDPERNHEVLVVIRPQANEVAVRYESSAGVESRSGLPLKEADFTKLGYVRFAGLNTASAYYVSHVNVVTTD